MKTESEEKDWVKVLYEVILKILTLGFYHVRNTERVKNVRKMNENPAYVCICGIFFVPLRRKRRKRIETWIAEHILYRFLTIRSRIKKYISMIDYTKTSDGLYAYR